MELLDQIALVIDSVADSRAAAAIILNMVPRALGATGGRPKKPLPKGLATPSEPLFVAPSKSLTPDLRSGSGSESDPESDSAELKDESPVFLEFLVTGKAKSWALREAHAAQYQAAFPDLDCEAQFRKAQLWCVNNPAKRKTAKGMSRFLQNWLDGAQNRGEGRRPQAAATTPRADNPVTAMMERAKAKWAGVK